MQQAMKMPILIKIAYYPNKISGADSSGMASTWIEVETAWARLIMKN